MSTRPVASIVDDKLAYTRGLLAMAEMDCTVTPGESIRLMADIMDQDKAYTDRVLGRTAA